MKLTYGEYLKLDLILNAQSLQSKPAEHDEMLFIIIHQTYELWFKQILHETEKLRKNLAEGSFYAAIKTYRRILTILKTLVGQIDILETMTPLEFNSFRSFLSQSSGFQSMQFRELEILCGLFPGSITKAFETEPESLVQLENRKKEATIWESFCRGFSNTGHPLTAERTREEGFVFEPSEKNQRVLLDLMNANNHHSILCELMVDFDEGLQEWRYRHVKMVERTIGTKKGTGGSDGASYLLKTLHQPIFPDLWAIRTKF